VWALAPVVMGQEAPPEGAAGPALFELPAVGGSLAGYDLGTPLGPDHPLELRALPGELLLIRLGARKAEPAEREAPPIHVEIRGEALRFEQSFAVWHRAPGTDLEDVWLALDLSPASPPGVYEGEVSFTPEGELLRVPLYLTLGSAALAPSPVRVLVVVPGPEADFKGGWAPIAGLGADWPERLPIEPSALDQQSGDLTLDLSRLEPWSDTVNAEWDPKVPYPLFLGPLMEEVCRRFHVEPLSGTYVLALHSLLSQLRDWSEERHLQLVFVPPTVDPEDDPEALRLHQHLVIMRETPGIRVLLPLEPLLELKRSGQRQLLALAQEYLARSPQGVRLLRDHRAEGRLWVDVPGGQRLRTGFWAWSVGADVVVVRGWGMTTHLLAGCALVDLRYLATLERLLQRAQENGDPRTQHFADEAAGFLTTLRQKVAQEVAEGSKPSAETAEAVRTLADDLMTWRDALRHRIDALTRVLQELQGAGRAPAGS